MPYQNNGDLNGDNIVNINDLNIIILNWNKNYYSEVYDQNIFIDIPILNQLIINWGNVFENETSIVSIEKSEDDHELIIKINNPKNENDVLKLYSNDDINQINELSSVYINTNEIGEHEILMDISNIPNGIYKLYYFFNDGIDGFLEDNYDNIIIITNSTPNGFDLEEFNFNRNNWNQKI